MRPPVVNPEPESVDVLHAYVLETVGQDPVAWPGGWPDEIEAALIDAVFSVRARYGNRERKTGVFGAVTRWREHRGAQADDLGVLAATEPDMLRTITNNGKVAGRYKAQIVVDAATALVKVSVVTAEDFRHHQDLAKPAYLNVKGCGPVTWAYLRMLSEVDDVKADTWVMRFVNDRLPNASQEEAAALLKSVAQRMHVDARRLDHAVWAYRRGPAQAPI